MPCELVDDEACEVQYPKAEPTDPEVWPVWSLYWVIQQCGWEMYQALHGETWTADESAWVLWAFARIHAAANARQAAEAKRKK